jgi:hypothetical protein
MTCLFCISIYELSLGYQIKMSIIHAILDPLTLCTSALCSVICDKTSQASYYKCLSVS